MKTLSLRHRETGEIAKTFDLTNYSPTHFDEFWDALVRKIDFEKWEPVYTPARGDDQTDEEWLRA